MADLSITPRPEDGPQLWYSDGKFVQRMDCDDIDNNFNPSDRDLKFMRSVLELALTQVAEWERAQQFGESGSGTRYTQRFPRPAFPAPYGEAFQ
jgi:hypothetical protein